MSTQAIGHNRNHTPLPDQADATGAQQTAEDDSALNRRDVFQREQDEFGGVKVGLAFFGWLTATGTAVILTAFVAAAGTAVGVATHTNASSATTQAANDPKTVGIVGAVVLLIILFVAYYCGGYVAGRMARFHGMRQGMAVWLWAVLIAAGGGAGCSGRRPVRRAEQVEQLPAHPHQSGEPDHRRPHRPGRCRGWQSGRGPAGRPGRDGLPSQGRQGWPRKIARMNTVVALLAARWRATQAGAVWPMTQALQEHAS